MRPLGVPHAYPSGYLLLTLTRARVRLTREQYATQDVRRTGPDWGGWIRTSDFLINSQKPEHTKRAQLAQLPSGADACTGSFQHQHHPKCAPKAYPRRTLTRTNNGANKRRQLHRAEALEGYARVRRSVLGDQS